MSKAFDTGAVLAAEILEWADRYGVALPQNIYDRAKRLLETPAAPVIEDRDEALAARVRKYVRESFL